MAKKIAVKQDNALKVQFTKERKAARLARHLKNHPNDAQSERNVLHNQRKKPFTKGSAPAKKWKLRNEAGFVWCEDPYERNEK